MTPLHAGLGIGLGMVGLIGLLGPVVSLVTLYFVWRAVRALEQIAATLRDQQGDPGQ